MRGDAHAVGREGGGGGGGEVEFVWKDAVWRGREASGGEVKKMLEG